jgi:20S proteasome alpha/beta subunit
MKVIDARKDEFIRCLRRNKPVTICIAAICDSFVDEPVVPKIVFCADHLVSSLVEFEHDIPKFKTLTDRCLVATAGDAVSSDMVLENVKERLSQPNTAATRIKEIVELVRQECRRLDDEEIDRNVLAKYNLARSNMPNVDSQVMTAKIIDEISDYHRNKPKFQFILFGFDSVREPHIHVLDQDGNDELADSLGFASIGSGSLLAFLYMTEHRFSPADDAQRAIPIVYFAKKVSERAQGVGRLTDLVIVYGRKDNDGKEKYKMVNMNRENPNNKIMNIMDKAFDEIEEFKHEKIEDMAGEINKMIKGEPSSSTPTGQSPNNDNTKASS